MALYAFDGTWRDAEEDPVLQWTNVRHFRDLYARDDDATTYYWDGVGRRLGLAGKVVGGGLGVGVDVRVNEARALLYEAFLNGDQVIDIIGFSRGAATATAFAWSIFRWGVRAPRNILPGTDGLKNVASGSFTHDSLADKPPIRFMGLFDTVFTTGQLSPFIPFMEYQKAQKGNQSFTSLLFKGDFSLPENVETAFHALSIHERDFGFDVTRIGNAYEVWFPGDHGDVGGGDKERHITNTTLQWMIAKAESAGIRFKEYELTEGVGGISDAVRRDGKKLARRIRPGDRIFENAADLPQLADIEGLAVERTDGLSETSQSRK